MPSEFVINKAGAADVGDLTAMVGELLNEIMHCIGSAAFHFDPVETAARLASFLAQEKYFVFVAKTAGGEAAGFIALYESYALYAEGAFGTIPELFVRPAFRSHAVGQRLIDEAKRFGHTRNWTRLEVTTPPLPQFDRTLAFYEREGFAISGGRKLKAEL